MTKAKDAQPARKGPWRSISLKLKSSRPTSISSLPSLDSRRSSSSVESVKQNSTTVSLEPVREHIVDTPESIEASQKSSQTSLETTNTEKSSTSASHTVQDPNDHNPAKDPQSPVHPTDSKPRSTEQVRKARASMSAILSSLRDAGQALGDEELLSDEETRRNEEVQRRPVEPTLFFKESPDMNEALESTEKDTFKFSEMVFPLSSASKHHSARRTQTLRSMSLSFGITKNVWELTSPEVSPAISPLDLKENPVKNSKEPIPIQTDELPKPTTPPVIHATVESPLTKNPFESQAPEAIDKTKTLSKDNVSVEIPVVGGQSIIECHDLLEKDISSESPRDIEPEAKNVCLVDEQKQSIRSESIGINDGPILNTLHDSSTPPQAVFESETLQSSLNNSPSFPINPTTPITPIATATEETAEGISEETAKETTEATIETTAVITTEGTIEATVETTVETTTKDTPEVTIEAPTKAAIETTIEDTTLTTLTTATITQVAAEDIPLQIPLDTNVNKTLESNTQSTPTASPLLSQTTITNKNIQLPDIQQLARHARRPQSLALAHSNKNVMWIQENNDPSDSDSDSTSSDQWMDPIALDIETDYADIIRTVDVKKITENHLNSNDQNEADKYVKDGVKSMFRNKFTKARSTFQTRAETDPLSVLKLGTMSFMKAIMTFRKEDQEAAMHTLVIAYTMANAQISISVEKKLFNDEFSQYFVSYVAEKNSKQPQSPAPNSAGFTGIIPNGVLRAHAIKAECCLLMALLQISQATAPHYLKAGLHLKRAHESYSIVWEEYQKMGQGRTKYMDTETISGTEFGIGTINLLLSSLPDRITKTFSVPEWDANKDLGYSLLKTCIKGKGSRSPLASLTLLAYHSLISSFAPRVYGKALLRDSIDCLLDAQKLYPNSCFFLFFAAQISRVANNIPLSDKSFGYAMEFSRDEWIEVAMRNRVNHEIGLNHMLGLEWEAALSCFKPLADVNGYDGSAAIYKYFTGVCLEMLGRRGEAIDAFEQMKPFGDTNVAPLVSPLEAYCHRRREAFRRNNYKHLDTCIPGLELLAVLHGFGSMPQTSLETCAGHVKRTLNVLSEKERIEQSLVLQGFGSNPPPNYRVERAALLLIMATVLNALGNHKESMAHLDWVLENKDYAKPEGWIVPLAYWEAGVVSWGLGDRTKSRASWQSALSCTDYDFEYATAVLLGLALDKHNDVFQ
ncbi:hypothetical protein CLU79DRAFT_750809 [Phycomyces nitens]|nr:hypothetical protein CLU79DRAFT_750809 [Phycomyces nitens]